MGKPTRVKSERKVQPDQPAVPHPQKPRKGDTATLVGFAKFCLVAVSPFVVWICYLWLVLQSGLFRTPVSDTGLRQVLIVGTQSSGTSNTAKELKALGLEVAHEYSDTRWSFSRDGTVSWFHGVRFLPGAPTSESLHELCRQNWPSMGFHPTMFWSSRHGCSFFSAWDKCWTRECKSLITSEWGCALSGGNQSGPGTSGSCETPYARQLLQVRHPLKTISSLAAKFCIHFNIGMDNVYSDLTDLAATLFPDSDRFDGDKHELKCIHVAGWYTVLYLEAMLAAHESGAIHDFYPVETTTPCEIAAKAGFLDSSSAVNSGAHAAAVRACEGERDASEAGGHRSNRWNQGALAVSISWQDVRDVDAELARRLQAAARRMGYADH